VTGRNDSQSSRKARILQACVEGGDRMPYLYRSFSTKEPHDSWLFCGKIPASKVSDAFSHSSRAFRDLSLSLSLVIIIQRTVWRRPIGCLKSQVICCKRASNHRALLHKMTSKDKASCDSTPLCIMRYLHSYILPQLHMITATTFYILPQLQFITATA